LSNEAFERAPEIFVANFDAGLGLFAKHGIRVVPVLFNRWRDPVCDFGGVALDHIVRNASHWTSREIFEEADPKRIQAGTIEWLHWRYLKRVVGEFGSDERVLMWDMCNEPLMGTYIDDAANPLRQDELRWLGWVYAACKSVGARQPLTIGNYPSVKALELTEPMSDVLSFHPYYIWNRPDSVVGSESQFVSFVDSCRDFAERAGKDLFASETVWGAVDDAKHVAIMRYTLGVLREREIGFTVHALHHSLVADLHKAEYGPVGSPECLHFINPDGSLRDGHGAFNDYGPAGSSVAAKFTWKGAR
jgi:hypothetical protein